MLDAWCLELFLPLPPLANRPKPTETDRNRLYGLFRIRQTGRNRPPVRFHIRGIRAIRGQQLPSLRSLRSLRLILAVRKNLEDRSALRIPLTLDFPRFRTPHSTLRILAPLPPLANRTKADYCGLSAFFKRTILHFADNQPLAPQKPRRRRRLIPMVRKIAERGCVGPPTSRSNVLPLRSPRNTHHV